MKRDDNNYYGTDPAGYSVVNEQFLDCLRREGSYVEDYWTGEKYHCFFRRNKDTNQTNDNISCYYATNEGIKPGTIILHRGEPYLVLNKETRENGSYHRSDALNADIMLNTFDPITGEELSIPCFAYDLTSPTPRQSDGNVMSVIYGNTELMTGDNEVSRKLRVNFEFAAMGNLYEIVSINHKTGITRIVASIITAFSHQPTYSLEIHKEEQYTVGDEVQLTATALRGEYEIEDQNLVWSGSDDTVATVSENGFVSFKASGHCDVTCYWEERGISTTATLTVNAVVPDLVCTITGPKTISVGDRETYSAKFYGPDGVTEDTTVFPVWNLIVPSQISSAITQSQSGKTITIGAGRSALGNTVVLEVRDANDMYYASKTIGFDSWL